MSDTIKITSVIERKHSSLPRFVLVPARAVAPWKLSGTTVIEGTLNNVEIGRRTLKKGDERHWFIDLPQPLCVKAQVDTGDSVTLLLRLASERLPEELAQQLAGDPVAKLVWERLTASQQRMVAEHVAAAKQSTTRKRRAERALTWHGA